MKYRFGGRIIYVEFLSSLMKDLTKNFKMYVFYLLVLKKDLLQEQISFN